MNDNNDNIDNMDNQENDDSIDSQQIEIPDTLPVLPVKDIVVFPFMIVPLFVSREITVAAVDMSLATDRMVFLAAQKDEENDSPQAGDIYDIGCVGMIMRMRKLVDGRIKILVQGMHRAKIVEYIQERPYISVKVNQIHDLDEEIESVRVEAIMRTAKENMEKVINLGKQISPDILLVIGSVEEPGRLADLIASNLISTVEQAQEILEIIDPVERLHKINELLDKEVKVLTMQAKIQNQAREEMSKSQRDYYLREQLRAIRSELGEGDGPGKEIEELEEKIAEAKMPEEAKNEAEKQLGRLKMMNPESSEASVTRTYLDWMIEVPWSIKTDDTVEIPYAREILDEDHYDLEKIKERILEFLGVRKLKKGVHKGPILCFAGPPGVGKTSLGKSIARAMGRKFVRISLGGVRDEAEMRGHRRTYVGAMPGKIIQGLKQAGTNNPVFMMDEIDKLGSDFRGDPSSALLEILDPEQNHAFVDHYLNLPFDLTDVMFIATANVLDSIPAPLRDRMEVIQLSGYSSDEKLHIAKRYLVPKQVEENGLTDKMISFSDNSLMSVILNYTRESGLRNLERQIGGVCRKHALAVAEGKSKYKKITPRTVEKFLGPAIYMSTEEENEDQVGVAPGLAWTPVGGEILYIEARAMKGGGQLILTGQLGDVMKESGRAALSYLRSRSDFYKIDDEMFEKRQIHVHVPAGAIPKDGPSAGVTMSTALFSALTGKKVHHDVAMTGEITLTGKVLPIGGLKVKILAALRAGIKTIVIPKSNEKDLVEIPPHLRKQFTPVLAKTIDDVLDVTIVKD